MQRISLHRISVFFSQTKVDSWSDVGERRGEHVNCKASFHGSCQQVTAALLLQLYFSLTLTRWLIWSSWLTLINWTLVWKVVLWITIAKGGTQKRRKRGSICLERCFVQCNGTQQAITGGICLFLTEQLPDCYCRKVGAHLYEGDFWWWI